MLKLNKITKNYGNKYFIINDRGRTIKIKQPNIIELGSLYYILLGNLMRVNKVNKS